MRFHYLMVLGSTLILVECAVDKDSFNPYTTTFWPTLGSLKGPEGSKIRLKIATALLIITKADHTHIDCAKKVYDIMRSNLKCLTTARQWDSIVTTFEFQYFVNQRPDILMGLYRENCTVFSGKYFERCKRIISKKIVTPTPDHYYEVIKACYRENLKNASRFLKPR